MAQSGFDTGETAMIEHLATWFELRWMVQSAERRVREIWRERSGATAIEYGLIVGGIALAIIVVVFLVGEDVAAMFKGVSDELDKARKKFQ